MKNLYPQIQEFLDALAAQHGPPIYSLSPEAARKALIDIQSKPVKKLPASIEDLSIPIGPKGTVDIRIIRPEGSTGLLPVVLWMHGGGWVLGNKQTHDRLMREIAHGANVAVVFVDYTQAPEAQYPLIHEEGYAVALWIAQQGNKHNLDVSRMAIAGDSVGGQLATAITMMVKERGGSKFKLQLLLYPVTNACFDTPSYNEFASGYWLERKGMLWFWDNYIPDKKIREQPLASPLRATIEQLKGLPPAVVIVGENDVLRDEGEAYAHKLMQAGVPIVATRYLGLIHDFALLNPIAEVPGVRQAIDQANQVLHKMLYSY